MKRKITVFLILLIVLFIPISAKADVESDLNNSVDEGLGNIDFSEVDDISNGFFGGVAEKIKDIIAGNFDSAEGFFKVVGSLFFGGVKKIIPQLAVIFAVLMILGLARKTNDGLISESTDSVIYFVGVTIVLTCSLTMIIGVYKQIYLTLEKINVLAEASLPIMLTLVIANGGNVLSSVCQPSMVMFTTLVIKIVNAVVLPLSVFSLAFAVVSNISSNVKVSKMSAFLNSSATWVLGVVFMLFSAFTTVQGISASVIDGVSYRAAKFATKSYIPILGGYLADGFDMVMASASLIKNAFGVVVLMLLLFAVVEPLITVLAVNLGLQSVAALSEPFADEKYIKMLSGAGKTLTFLSVLLLAVAFMFCVMIMIAICCVNGV